MTSAEHKKLQDLTKSIQQSSQTIFKVPYRDTLTGCSYMTKELLLKGYQNNIGKTFRYVDMDWKIVDVSVINDEIRVILCK